MNKKTLILIVVIVAVLIGVMIFSRRVEDNLNPDMIYEASEETGGLPEKVIGDLNTAKVILYEYADYACVHCAEWNTIINALVEESDGKLAVVYRGYSLGLTDNDELVALAGTAAQVQGYWKEYKDLLFKNQSVWTSLDGEALKYELGTYFAKASNQKGDTVRFMDDMMGSNAEIAKKVTFEHKLGKKIKLKGTPTFRIDGENIETKRLKEIVAEKLANI